LKKLLLDMVAAYRPRHELQKVAPRNFDAFFLPRKQVKKDSRNSCGAVPRKGRPAFAIRGFSGAISSFACRNQAAETKEGKIP
jgi:hypothetical protein